MLRSIFWGGFFYLFFWRESGEVGDFAARGSPIVREEEQRRPRSKFYSAKTHNRKKEKVEEVTYKLPICRWWTRIWIL